MVVETSEERGETGVWARRREESAQVNDKREEGGGACGMESE